MVTEGEGGGSKSSLQPWTKKSLAKRTNEEARQGSRRIGLKRLSEGRISVPSIELQTANNERYNLVIKLCNE